MKELLTSDLWEIIPIGVTVKDSGGTIVWVNDCGCQLLKLHSDQIIGRSGIDSTWGAIHEDGSPLLDSEFPSSLAFATGRPVRQQVVGIKTTEIIWLLVDAIPKLNEDGQVLGVVSTFTDITAKKEAEKQRLLQAKRIQALLDNSFNGVVVLQGNKVIEVNSRFAQMLGYSVSEVLQLTPKDWEPQIIDRIKPAGVTTQVYESIHYRKDGSTYNAEVAVNYLEMEGKEFYILMVKDITDQKTTETALKESREQFINILRSVSDSVAYIDRDYVLRFANNIFLDRFADLGAINCSFAGVIDKELFRQVKPKLDQCLQGEVVRFYQWVTYPGIGRRYEHIIYSPYRNSKGEILGVVSSGRDLTRQKLTEDKLEIQRLQDHLIATIANELLRTSDYHDIFDKTLPIVRNYLNCDQVVIYEFTANSEADIVGYAVAPGVKPMASNTNKYVVNANVWEQDLVERITDIDNSNFSEDYRKFLRSSNVKAKMMLGIWCDQELWGAISVHQAKVRSWSDMDAEFICRVATLVGVAISKTKLYQTTQTQLAQSKLLYQLSNYLKDTIDLDEAFSYVVERVGELFPDSLVSIQKFIPEHQLWHTQASYPADETGYAIKHQGNPISQQLLERKIVDIPDTNIVSDRINDRVAQRYSGAWLIVPICLESKAWGCISICHFNSNNWHPETKQFLQTIAAQITIALKKYQETSARINAETDLKNLNIELESMVMNRTTALMESQALLVSQFEQEQLLTKISNRIRDSLEISQILQNTTQEVKDLIKCDRVIIYRLLPSGKGEVVAESVRPGIVSLMGIEFDSEVFPPNCYQDYLEGRIAVISSLQESDEPCIAEFMASLQVRASITIGIVFDEQLWGLLILHQCDNDREWKREEVSFIQKISVPLSVAIKQAALYKRMEEQLAKWIEVNYSLGAKLKEEQLMNLILERIRWSFDLTEIFAIIATELRHFLQVDRVTILRIDKGIVVQSFQSPHDSPITMLDCQPVLAQFSNGGYYEDCYKLILPIVTDTRPVWGLLSIFNRLPTKWSLSTINFLTQVNNQLGIAVTKIALQQKMENELRQKNALLKEVHHRVKNNLQIMSSLFRLQARKLDKCLNPAIEDAQNRIYAMALVHEQLYSSSNSYDSIEMKEYVSKLVDTIFNTYNIRSGDIELITNIPPIAIPLDKTIPLGLIFNELITNALKYAFPDGRGQITIDVTTIDNSVHIVVADNGVGLPPNFDLNKINSLGILLISDLTDQLEGKFSCHNHNGAVFTIEFPYQKNDKRSGA